eukprot:5956629-Heterocapsa_arctica.AAC.1
MKTEDQCHECKGKGKSDGDRGPRMAQSFTENGALKGISQSSDRAEVRALVAAPEKAEEEIEIITDNQHVRDTAQCIAAGRRAHKGKHSDLWNRIKSQIHKMTNIRW